MDNNIYLFKTYMGPYRKFKYESHFFIKKIIIPKMKSDDFDTDVLYNDTLWKYIDLFQEKKLSSKNQIKNAFIILSILLIKTFPSLESLTSSELLILISLGKDIALTASEIPDTINFVKNYKNMKKIALLFN